MVYEGKMYCNSMMELEKNVLHLLVFYSSTLSQIYLPIYLSTFCACLFEKRREKGKEEG